MPCLFWWCGVSTSASAIVARAPLTDDGAINGGARPHFERVLDFLHTSSNNQPHVVTQYFAETTSLPPARANVDL